MLIDGDGRMKSGKFAGETMKGAFGKGGKADKLSADKKPGEAGDKSAPDGGEPKVAPAIPAASEPLHPSLADPSAMTKADVKSAFASVDREKHKQLVDDISKVRPDLAGEANYRWQTSGPKKKVDHVSTANEEAFEVNADTAKARVADGRSAFPRVAAPYSKAKLGISLANKFNLPIENVPVSKLVTSQKDVNPWKVDYFAKGGEDDPSTMQPYVIKVGDKYHIEYGNHRLSADVLNGKTSIPVRVMTLDADGKWDGKLATAPAASAPPKVNPTVPPVPPDLAGFEKSLAGLWQQEFAAGKVDALNSKNALAGVTSQAAKDYHATLLKAAGVDPKASPVAAPTATKTPVKVSKPISEAARTGVMPANPDLKKVANDLQEYYGWAESQGQLAYDEYDFAKLPKEHQTEFNSLSAFIAGGFVGMNADPSHPASVKLNQLVDKLPDAKPKTMYRVLGFANPEAKQSYIDSIAGPHGQPKAFSSWTENDPTKAGIKPVENIGLDVAAQFGEHSVILKYDNPQGAKDISFAYGKSVKGGVELLLRKGHQMETKAVSTDANGRTVITVGPSSAAPAVNAGPATIAAKPSKAKDAYQDAAMKAKAEKILKGASMASLVGAPDDSQVSVALQFSHPTGDRSSWRVEVKGDGIKRMERVVKYSADGGLVIDNIDLKTTKPGLGRQLLRDQVSNAIASGVKQITAEAAGHGPKSSFADEGKESQFNGYYTWARYGYDSPLDKIPGASTRNAVKAKFPEAENLSDVMATAEGRSWWKDNGSRFFGTFDTTPGSRSMNIFTAYLKAKGEL